jgi:hypothetical protein
MFQTKGSRQKIAQEYQFRFSVDGFGNIVEQNQKCGIEFDKELPTRSARNRDARQ